jgi:alkylhydroperoxidase/carboxymuconolactone decarboxylase family protein YurZ
MNDITEGRSHLMSHPVYPVTTNELRKGATEHELMEAIWVAAEMRAGGAYAHSVIALDAAASGSDGQAS